MLQTKVSKQLTIFEERINSLLEDGYVIQIKSVATNKSLWFAFLRHRTNHHHVHLYAYPDKNRIVQKSNGHIVHDSPLL